MKIKYFLHLDISFLITFGNYPTFILRRESDESIGLKKKFLENVEGPFRKFEISAGVFLPVG